MELTRAKIAQSSPSFVEGPFQAQVFGDGQPKKRFELSTVE